MATKTHAYTVTLDEDGVRLDHFLSQKDLGLSKRKVKTIIDAGGVLLNRKRCRIASHIVRRGDQVRLEYAEATLRPRPQPGDMLRDLTILQDLGDILAINKPAGLPSQATQDASMVHVIPAVEAQLRAQGDRREPLFLVHRLDKETTGVLLLAIGSEAATWLLHQFRERRVAKTYYALCHGVPRRSTFTERAPLSEIDRKTGNVRAVHAGGRPAVTHVKVLAVNPSLRLCLVECHPETGRSHQIRVHLDLNGLPIVGDKRYGGGTRRELPPDLGELAAMHHFLHAGRLDFVPGEGRSGITVKAPLPPRLTEFARIAGLATDGLTS